MAADPDEETVDGYYIPVDPADETICEACS